MTKLAERVVYHLLCNLNNTLIHTQVCVFLKIQILFIDITIEYASKINLSIISNGKRFKLVLCTLYSTGSVITAAQLI